MSRRHRRGLLLSDFAGHAFTYELADSLVRRGHDAAYSYCEANVSPKGGFTGSVDVDAVGSGWSFEKYRPLRRLASELRYGVALSRTVRRRRPRDHVMCNMPLISGTACWLLTRFRGPRLVVWFQDAQAGLAASSGGLAGRMLSGVETFLLRRADRVIAISEPLAEEARRRGVQESRIRVLPNWAPIEQLPAIAPGDTAIVGEIEHHRPLFLYSGTLGRKHDPSLLLDLAHVVTEFGGSVVVISEGEGADWLQRRFEETEGDIALTVLPYQPFARLSDVLGAADVLIVILEASAGAFSVPSKTLSYLCAGRAILASIPLDNAAATLVAREADAGLVADPSDRSGFLDNARRLGLDPSLRDLLGARGRRYAERTFREEIVVERFLDAL